MSSPGSPRGCADALSRAAAVRSEREPEDEELVEREPHASDLRLGKRARTVDGDERIRPHRQALGGEQRRQAGPRRRRRRARAPARAGRGASSASRPRRRGRRVRSRRSPPRRRGRTRRPRNRACSRGRGRESRVPATSFASSHGWLNQVALISPVSSAIRAVRILQSTAAATRRRADDALDDRLLVAEQVTDPLRRHWLLVPPRPLPEKISRPSSDRAARDGVRSSGRRRRASRPRRRAPRASARSAGAARRQARRVRRSRPAAPRERSSHSQPSDHYRSDTFRRSGRDATRPRKRTPSGILAIGDPRSRIPDLRD